MVGCVLARLDMVRLLNEDVLILSVYVLLLLLDTFSYWYFYVILV